MIPAFSLTTTPRVHFGNGRIADLPSLISEFGNRILLVTGKQSFTSSIQAQIFLEKADRLKFSVHQC